MRSAAVRLEVEETTCGWVGKFEQGGHNPTRNRKKGTQRIPTDCGHRKGAGLSRRDQESQTKTRFRSRHVDRLLSYSDGKRTRWKRPDNYHRDSCGRGKNRRGKHTKSRDTSQRGSDNWRRNSSHTQIEGRRGRCFHRRRKMRRLMFPPAGSRLTAQGHCYS